MLRQQSDSGRMADYDLAIIGGGINGAGIARDAAGRGLRVLLVEQNDLASGTSSASTKLIHGGLRYLEHGAFRLVREALAEREVLLGIGPHLIWPMRFVLPAPPSLRSPLLLRLGLFLYDRFGGRKVLPATRKVDLSHDSAGLPLKRQFKIGFEYSYCCVDDARLVIVNALDAAERGASIRTRTRCARAERKNIWRLTLLERGRRQTVTARALVNAAGPWVAQVAETALRMPQPGRVRLDKGSHIVVPKLFDEDRAYVLQTRNRRVVFVIPFARDFTLIGTTDQGFTGDLSTVTPSMQEIRYLCSVVNVYFRAAVTVDQVIWSFSGVRALYDDGTAKVQDATRDYVLNLDKRLGEAPLLTVYGGKITTYRRLAEAVLARLARFFHLRPAWTAAAPLPGGDLPGNGIDALVAKARHRWPFLTEDHAVRLARAYGTRIDRLLGSAASLADLGPNLGGDLTGAEVRYLIAHEWACTADDVLWRRSKLGLRLTGAEREALTRFMADTLGERAAE
jgi:glycerol-3-phosphate dehydrogenase